MKARLKGKIVSTNRLDGDIRIQIESTGKVETKNINAQECSLGGLFQLKGLSAENMKLGSILTITISDEDSDERST